MEIIRSGGRSERLSTAGRRTFAPLPSHLDFSRVVLETHSIQMFSNDSRRFAGNLFSSRSRRSLSISLGQIFERFFSPSRTIRRTPSFPFSRQRRKKSATETKSESIGKSSCPCSSTIATYGDQSSFYFSLLFPIFSTHSFEKAANTTSMGDIISTR